MMPKISPCTAAWVMKWPTVTRDERCARPRESECGASSDARRRSRGPDEQEQNDQADPIVERHRNGRQPEFVHKRKPSARESVFTRKVRARLSHSRRGSSLTLRLYRQGNALIQGRGGWNFISASTNFSAEVETAWRLSSCHYFWS
jgi:hypothetical protein